MCNKFTMELVWHNCETHPPKEDYHPCLYLTNGISIFPMSWKRYTNAQCFERNGVSEIEVGKNAKKYWWADMTQTIRNEPRFKDLK